jgi:hypothetical protein
MTLHVEHFNEYRCDQCGHVRKLYAHVEPPTECEKCKKIPPENFDYPILKRAISEAIDTFITDMRRYTEGRADSLMDEIEDGFRWRLQDKEED